MGLAKLLLILGAYGFFIASGTLGEETYSAMLDTNNILLIQNKDAKEWNYVCPSTFTAEAGNVVCKQMGYPGLADIREAPNPDTTKSMLNVSFQCVGSRKSLSDCRIRSMKCEEKDVVVKVDCIPLTPLSVRLIDPVASNGGQIQVFGTDNNSNQRWITLCQESLDDNTANVICNTVGFYGFLNKNYKDWGIRDSVAMKFNCDPEKHRTLSECGQQPAVECTSDTAATVNCDIFYKGQLFSGRKGRSEKIYYFEVYLGFFERASVCSGPTAEDGDALCRSNGHGNMNRSLVLKKQNSRTKLISYAPNCKKGQLLNECPVNFESRGECDVDTVYGIQCNDPPLWSIKLQKGKERLETVSVFTENGKWEFLCFNNFTKADASVMCKDLGFTGLDAEVSPAIPSRRFGSKALNIQCEGTENSVKDCLRNTVGCSTEFIVTLRCIDTEPTMAPPGPTPTPIKDEVEPENVGALGPLWLILVVAIVSIVLILIVCIFVVMFSKPSNYKRLK